MILIGRLSALRPESISHFMDRRYENESKIVIFVTESSLRK
jgi:hypothetical protein